MSKQLIKKTQHQLLVALILFPLPLLAAESDKLLPWEWFADGNTQMRIEGDNTIWELSENVRVTRGTLEILGDQATIELSRSTNELNKVTVTGNPAHYQ